MSLLRDVDLTLCGVETQPDWFWRRLPVEYLFYRQLRALKIATPDVMKVRVCCAAAARPYDGNLVDGVSSVEVQADFAALESLPAMELSRSCVGLMAAGVKAVLAFFGVAATGIDEAGERALAELEDFSIPVGKPVKHPQAGLSAQLHVQLVDQLQACVAVLVLKAGRKQVGLVPVCTTFPFPESALDSFKSLTWVGRGAVEVGFRIAGTPARTLFGRTNFDCAGLDHVKLASQTEAMPPFFARDVVFAVDLAAITGAQP